MGSAVVAGHRPGGPVVLPGPLRTSEPHVPYARGRHEHGQNFLTHRPTVEAMVSLAAAREGPLVELAAGDGALTRALLRLGRPVTAVEIDGRHAATLRRGLGDRVDVVVEDLLRFRLPAHEHVVVANLPFHLTTAALRRLLRAPGWTRAVLLVQWEVARRRAGVGGSTMMTAQWAPWFEFALDRRVPASAFRPRPGVDGGLLVVDRRPTPLLPVSDRRAFQALVHAVFTGPGRGLGQVLPRAGAVASEPGARSWLRSNGLPPAALPRDLDAMAWADLYRVSGVSPPGRRRGRRR